MPGDDCLIGYPSMIYLHAFANVSYYCQISSWLCRQNVSPLEKGIVLFCMLKRKFTKNVLNHCYQRTADHGVLFYNVRDHIVFFTVFCVLADRHKVRVLKLVQMPDHIHHSSIAEREEQLSAFERDFTSIYAREYNGSFGRTGPLFEARFNSAPKKGDKAIRTNLLYLDNNPVERKLVASAQEYQWGYCAYATANNPFSNKIRLRFASMPLRRALKQVKILHKNKQYLTYKVITRLFDSLPNDYEKDQLTDYIIKTYSVIDHKTAARFFGGHDKEMLAASSNTGSEYDINEEFIGKDDRYYAQFSNILRKGGHVKDIHDIFTMSEKKRRDLFTLLRLKTMAPKKQICSFLHLPVDIID